MAILAFGSGPTSLAPAAPDTTKLLADTTAGHLAPYVTVGTKKTADGTTSYPIVNFADSADFWVSFYSYSDNHPGSWSPLIIWDDLQDLFQMDTDIATGTLVSMEYWNGSTWTEIATDVAGMVETALNRHDIHIVMHNTTGVIDWYLNGQLAQTYSGDTIFTSSTTANKLTFANNSATGTHFMVVSAVIVADEDTRGMEYAQRFGTSDGALTDMTGSYTDVDDTTTDDTNYLTSTVSGDQQTVACGAISSVFASNYDAIGVGVCARAKQGASGGDLKLLCRSSTTVGQSSTKTLDLTYDHPLAIFATDPNTASAWSVANADACQVGVESV